MSDAKTSSKYASVCNNIPALSMGTNGGRPNVVIEFKSFDCFVDCGWQVDTQMWNIFRLPSHFVLTKSSIKSERNIQNVRQAEVYSKVKFGMNSVY